MTSEPRGPLPRAIVILLGIAALVVVIAGFRSAAWLLGPALLALVLTIVVHPIRGWLDRRMPGWLASLICIIAVYLIVLSLAISIGISAARFATLLPDYQAQFADRISQLTDWISSFGISDEQIDQITGSFDLGGLTSLVESLLAGALNAVSSVVFILTLALFMGMDGGTWTRNLIRAADIKPHIVSAIRDFAHGTRTYYAVSTIFGAIVAILDTIALEIIGVPSPVLWGLLAFITNYIPNIGFVIGLIPPAILGLLEGGPGMMLAVIIVYCVLNVVIQTVIQPKFVGDAVGLSTTLTFISLVFWTWVIGPLGALLAIPLTLLAKALLVDIDPSAQWLRPLISNKEEPPTEAEAT
ncbi:AI-2E family transporter [Nocardioides sp. CN2-186]|uniref:AI-2E family transporter n=1 Tax=Nocardioides tweenelious TaxID=3156607 RepID=UPI0032B6259E